MTTTPLVIRFNATTAFLLLEIVRAEKAAGRSFNATTAFLLPPARARSCARS